MNNDMYISNKMKYIYQLNNNNIGPEASNFNPNRNNYREDPPFFTPISNYDYPGHIIHKSTEHSFDQMGNSVVTTKTVRELDPIGNNAFQQSTRKYVSKTIKGSKQNKLNKKPHKILRYKNARNEAQRQRALYTSPDFQKASPYASPLHISDLNDSEYKRNYKYESNNINRNGKNPGKIVKKEIYKYIDKNGNSHIFKEKREESPDIHIISPIGYNNLNTSSGSDFEENQVKSFDNFKFSEINDSKYNLNQTNNRKLNYEIEDPEKFDYLQKNENNKNNGKQYMNKNIYNNNQYLNRSEYKTNIFDNSYQSDRKDFQSPDRNINDNKKFRNVTVGMIDSKGPTNDDNKVTKIMTTRVINIKGDIINEKQVRKIRMYKNKESIPNKPYKIRKNLSQVEAAKIIQSWWRKKNNREEEVYDITVKKAIKLQSYIRGFLVRKKVLRYITLAIYYQYFCDRIQDALCNYVKRTILQLFRKKFLYNNNGYNNIYPRSPKKPIINNRNYNIPNNINITKREMTTYPNLFFNDQSPISYINPISPITYIDNSPIDYRSPDTYQNNSLKTDVKIYHISPDIYNTNASNYDNRTYNKNVNDEIINREYSKYTTINNRNYYNYDYNKIDNINERDRNISPTFGILSRNNITSNRIYTSGYSETNLNNRRRIYNTGSSPNIASTRTTKKTKKIITSEKPNKHPVKVTTNQRKKVIIKKNTNISKKPKQNNNVIISGGTLSIVKLPNQKTYNNTQAEKILKRIKEEKIEKYEKYEKAKKDVKFKELNQIDNQLSINIVKIPEEKDDKIIQRKSKNAREEYIKYIEKPVEIIKEKEKIIIQKEPKPETAEEGNDRQLFDMTISKNVAMSIEALAEKKEVIKNELKEIEIYKKKEREKIKQINKFKKDIKLQKLKNKYDKLKGVIRITDYWKNRILGKKFNQYKINCSSVPKTYEIEVGTDIQINEKPKETIELAIQNTVDKVEKGSQAIFEIEEKRVNNFDLLQISKDRSFSFEQKTIKKEKPENKITQSKLNIISTISKQDSEQQSEPWKTEIIKQINDINILNSKPDKIDNFVQYIQPENVIDESNQLEILTNKPKLVDSHIQHDPLDNFIDNKKVIISINATKPEMSESITQYEQPESKIINNAPISFIGQPEKEEIIKVETREAECNTFTETMEQGINAVIEVEQKPKNIEVKISTVKRSLYKMEIPLLKKLWLKKAFKTFRDNCNRPEYHKIIGREILRMALLKWRFIKGYGPDRYGNAYDRDGNLLYQTKAKVADMQVQHDFVVEKEDQSTQFTPIENIISTLKQFEINAAYKRKIEPEKVDKSVGNNVKIVESIQRGESISYKNKEKKKPENIVAKNHRLEIKKTVKDLREQGTEMPVIENKISNLEKINISGDEYKLKNKKNIRQKELLIKMIYKKMMGDKLTLSDSLRQWLKQTILLLQTEQFDFEKKKRRYASISKNDRFEIIEEIKKMEMGTQIEKQKNIIETMPNINVIKVKNVEDSEINVNMPSQFNIEKIKPQNENIISYESNKKPIILETQKENEMNIYSQNYIFNEEIKKGIHHPMTEESKKRVNEILIKFFQTRGVTTSILKKYFTIWNRKANYLNCLENAKIIRNFCRRKLNIAINYKRWKKICEKLILREKIKIIKLSKKEEYKRNKIFDLIRLTRINTEYTRKRYLHYIILCWLAYKRNLKKKREDIKVLYENMLNTYMNMADDVFGKNQKDNPSVQDALFEIIDSNKFKINDLEDVPIAENYYEDKKYTQKVTTNLVYVNNDDTDKDKMPKESLTYKAYITNKPLSNLPNSFSSGNIKERKIIKEKIVRIEPDAKLQSNGRGRKYRTKVEREILSKFYDDKQLYNNYIIEKDDKEPDIDENIINDSKNITIKITKNNITNNMGSSYTYSMNMNKMNESDINKIPDYSGNSSTYNIGMNDNGFNKKEILSRKRRVLYGSRFNEDEKEMEKEN